MKKLAVITASLVALACHQVQAQGTVTWSNRATQAGASQLITFGSHLTDPAKVGQGVATTDGLVVELLWSPDNVAAYVPISGPVEVGRSSATALNPGRYVGPTATTGSQTLPGTPAWFMLRAWETAYGATYAAASQNMMGGRGAYIGQSIAWMSANTGNPTTVPPGTPLNLASSTIASQNLQAFTVSAAVPEPSAIALGVLGAGMLLMLVRRK